MEQQKASKLPWLAPDNLYWRCPTCGEKTYETTNPSRLLVSSPQRGVFAGETNDIETRWIVCAGCKQEWHLRIHRDGTVNYSAPDKPDNKEYMGSYLAVDREKGGWLTLES